MITLIVPEKIYALFFNNIITEPVDRLKKLSTVEMISDEAIQLCIVSWVNCCLVLGIFKDLHVFK